MTPSLDGLNLQGLALELPKRFAHVKEEMKLIFLRSALKLACEEKRGWIDFKATRLEGREWKFVYLNDSPADEVEVCEQIMTKWYFGNERRNENVYFYRFLNVIRAELGEPGWERVRARFESSSDETLRENLGQYLGYREKLDWIETHLKERGLR